MGQDRPTAVELVTAVREFLTRDIQPAVEGRLAFHTRVAANALGMIERELSLGPEIEAAERDRATKLLGHDGDVRDLEREIAERIRDHSLDERAEDVGAHVRATVRAKLEIANPGYLGEDEPG